MRKYFSIFIPVLIIVYSIFMSILFHTSNSKYQNLVIERSYIQNGKYYTIEHPNKNVEVRKEEWIFIKYIVPMYHLIFFLALLSIAYIDLKFIAPYFLYNRSPKDAFEASNLVRSSASAIISFRFGGKIGKSRYNNPLLKVELYPKGLWIKPLIIINPFAIFIEDIISITEKDKDYKKVITINHKSKVIKTPIILNDSINSAGMRKMISMIRQEVG